MKRKNNLITLILLACYAMNAACNDGLGEWRFIQEDDSIDGWRKEANYWYDECEKYNNTTDDVAFGEKVSLLKTCVGLEEENQRLTTKIQYSYPEKINIETIDIKYQIDAIEAEINKHDDAVTAVLREKNLEIKTLERQFDQDKQEKERLEKYGKERGLFSRDDIYTESRVEKEFKSFTDEKLSLTKKVEELRQKVALQKKGTPTPGEELLQSKHKITKLEKENRQQSDQIKELEEENDKIKNEIKSLRESMGNKSKEIKAKLAAIQKSTQVKMDRLNSGSDDPQDKKKK